MRVRIDRGTGAIHLALAGAEARRVEVADGVALAYDADGRVVGVELRGVEAAALHEFSVELAGLADRPAAPSPAPAPFASPPAYAASPRAPRTPPEPQVPRYEGPLTWDAEAEAAMGRIPFFDRGKARLAASALARRRGQDRVTLDIVTAAGPGVR